MRALFYSIGTRGDAEPFLALAEILKNAGWDVVCVFPEQFRTMVEELGITFYGFDKRFLELLEGNTGKTIMGGSGSFWEKFKALINLFRSSWKLQDQLLGTQKELIDDYLPDKIFYHPKCVYPVIWEIVNPGSTIMVCPIPCIVHEVKELTTMGLKGNGNYGPFLNSMSYWVVNWIRTRVFFLMSRKYRKDLSPVKITSNDIYNSLVNKTKTFYSISPSLFPRPPYWSEHLYVTGFLERSKTSHWKPDQDLLTFLSNHQKILLITFGSMKNRDPEAKTKALLNVLSKHHIPAIINTSWGGLTKTNHDPEHVHFVDNIPYDWIFPKMYAVVHHGGSGTTHTACKYGCPSLIVPHIVDQFFWNNRMAALGLGPKGVQINRLSEKSLDVLLIDLWDNPKYKDQARKVQKKMMNEGQPDHFIKLIQEE